MKIRNCAFLFVFVVNSFAQQEKQLKVEQVMTLDEQAETGVALLTDFQRATFNKWLTAYTLAVIKAVQDGTPTPVRDRTPVPAPPVQDKTPTSIIQNRAPIQRRTPLPRVLGASCAPAIETTISGDVNGWDGETIFKLDNGQIWQQAEYDYTYFYEYRPDVTIYSTSSGCRMKVDGEDETIIVKRIK